ncbi:NIPSNAP family protein [Desulfogranum mediterraneum]|uniref:NIPSNAP family protein n=1 Tax=Desulfogranum mediterraneum TaxID=160661 RepID=UPI001ABF47A2|nr:NIPSNAP family protein [Desulfogranum mediterraneum]
MVAIIFYINSIRYRLKVYEIAAWHTTLFKALRPKRELLTYEEYREKMWVDTDCKKAFEYADETKCIIRYERSFMKPIFE